MICFSRLKLGGSRHLKITGLTLIGGLCFEEMSCCRLVYDTALIDFMTTFCGLSTEVWWLKA